MKVYLAKSILVSFAFCLCALGTFGQKKTLKDQAWRSFLNLNHYLTPFWEADTIYDELIQPIKRKSSVASGGLLFEAKTILSVTDAFLQNDYKKKDDWKYKQKRILLAKKSKIPFFQEEDLIFKIEKKGTSLPGKIPGNFVLHNERGLFQSKQVAVTYIKKTASHWNGPIPEFSDTLLPVSLKKLREGKAFKIVFFGNSIETGANSSGFIGTPPFLPTWPEMVIYRLRQKYGENIDFQNKSVGGKMAKWGMENTGTLVVPENPDLVIIGFGMNDGTNLVDPVEYAAQIQSMIDQVRSDNKACEFIIITPMLPNPDARHNQKQALYRHELYKFKNRGIAIADMTTVHEELLKNKSYQDMTGNNINHPNDYLARWYAMMINGYLVR